MVPAQRRLSFTAQRSLSPTRYSLSTASMNITNVITIVTVILMWYWMNTDYNKDKSNWIMAGILQDINDTLHLFLSEFMTMH